MKPKRNLTKKNSSIEAVKSNLRNETKQIRSGFELTPIIKLLKGSFKAPEDFNYKVELTNQLSGKYL